MRRVIASPRFQLCRYLNPDRFDPLSSASTSLHLSLICIDYGIAILAQTHDKYRVRTSFVKNPHSRTHSIPLDLV